MHPFGQTLYEWLQRNPDRRTVVFKSDVASAFLNLPGHPVMANASDRCCRWSLVHSFGVWFFGNRASPRIWCSVSGLLCWIAVRKLEIASLHVYMDDFFGLDFEGNEVFLPWEASSSKSGPTPHLLGVCLLSFRGQETRIWFETQSYWILGRRE
jgi:hypothetical protein